MNLVGRSCDHGGFPSVFSHADGAVLRYRWKQLGETGNTEYNIFFVDGFVYIQALHTRYASHIMHTNTVDSLSYELRQYIVDGSATFRIDDIGETLMPADDEAFAQLPLLAEEAFAAVEIAQTTVAGPFFTEKDNE